MVLNRVRLFLIGVGLSAALPVLPPAAGKLIAVASTSVATVTTFAILDAPFRSYGCGEGAIAVTRRGGARLFACMHVMWRATSTLGNGLFPPFLLCVVLGWRRCGAGPLRVCGHARRGTGFSPVNRIGNRRGGARWWARGGSMRGAWTSRQLVPMHSGGLGNSQPREPHLQSHPDLKVGYI